MRKSEVEHRHIRYGIDGQKRKEAFIFSTQLVITGMVALPGKA